MPTRFLGLWCSYGFDWFARHVVKSVAQLLSPSRGDRKVANRAVQCFSSICIYYISLCVTSFLHSNFHSHVIMWFCFYWLCKSYSERRKAWNIPESCSKQAKVFAQMMMASATKSCQMFMPTSFQSMMIPRSSHHGRRQLERSILCGVLLVATTDT